LAVVFLVGYAWLVLDTSLSPRGRMARVPQLMG
jgi:hypothetical protein